MLTEFRVPFAGNFASDDLSSSDWRMVFQIGRNPGLEMASIDMPKRAPTTRQIS